jgi:sec-independent protein translocase protein TatA
MGGRVGELLLIVLIVFILFGAGKLPRVMGEIGKGMRALKKSLQIDAESNDKKDEENK